MRVHFELNRIFPLANLIIFALLVYAIFTFYLEDSGRGHSMEPKPKSSQNDFDPIQKSPNNVNPDIIVNRNIFNPPNTLASQKVPKINSSSNQSSEPAVKKPLELKLLGTVAGNEEIACAIIQDMKTRVQDVYKTGDFIQGARIEKIERNRIILLNEGIKEIITLYVADKSNENFSVSTKEMNTNTNAELPPADIIKKTSPTERQVNKKAFLAKIGGIEAIMRTVQITPHTVNGKADGLQISGLEGLSMAKFVGLENGDIIQKINGQIVTENRKAFQVLQKARALSSLDMELMRGSEKKTLSFKIQ